MRNKMYSWHTCFSRRNGFQEEMVFKTALYKKENHLFKCYYVYTKIKNG